MNINPLPTIREHWKLALGTVTGAAIIILGTGLGVGLKGHHSSDISNTTDTSSMPSSWFPMSLSMEPTSTMHVNPSTVMTAITNPPSLPASSSTSRSWAPVTSSTTTSSTTTTSSPTTTPSTTTTSTPTTTTAIPLGNQWCIPVGGMTVETFLKDAKVQTSGVISVSMENQDDMYIKGPDGHQHLSVDIPASELAQYRFMPSLEKPGVIDAVVKIAVDHQHYQGSFNAVNHQCHNLAAMGFFKQPVRSSENRAAAEVAMQIGASAGR